mgnify:CR=1 FL=1
MIRGCMGPMNLTGGFSNGRDRTDGLAQISAALAVLNIGTATEEEAIAAINANVPRT